MTVVQQQLKKNDVAENFQIVTKYIDGTVFTDSNFSNYEGALYLRSGLGEYLYKGRRRVFSLSEILPTSNEITNGVILNRLIRDYAGKRFILYVDDNVVITNSTIIFPDTVSIVYAKGCKIIPYQSTLTIQGNVLNDFNYLLNNPFIISTNPGFYDQDTRYFNERLIFGDNVPYGEGFIGAYSTLAKPKNFSLGIRIGNPLGTNDLNGMYFRYIPRDSGSYTTNLEFWTCKYAREEAKLLLNMVGETRRVGLKVADPQADLDINGTLRLRGLVNGGTKMLTTNVDGDFFIQDIPTTTSQWINGANNSITYKLGNIGVGIDANTNDTINVNGNILSNGYLKVDSSGPGLWLNTPSNKGIFMVYASGYLQFRRRLSNFGADDGCPIFIKYDTLPDGFITIVNNSFGINTNGPTATLDVNGSFRYRGGSPGIGKVATSDTDGNVSWQSPSNNFPTYQAITAATTIVASTAVSQTIHITAGTFTQQLPNLPVGSIVIIKNTSVDGSVTVTPFAGSVDNSTSLIVESGTSISLQRTSNATGITYIII